MIQAENLKYTRVAAAVPALTIMGMKENAEQMAQMMKRAEKEHVNVLVFPELSITGYTCADLFSQQDVWNRTIDSLLYLKEESKSCGRMLIFVGAPVFCDNQLFNCAVAIQNGRILGVVPKTHLPNYNEFYEVRWFASSKSRISDIVVIGGEEVPFGEDLLFCDDSSELVVGVDICEDLWVPIPPSTYHTMYGANLIVNLSASNETISKQSYRRDIIKSQSGKCITGYVYCSSGPAESTTDLVFSGHCVIAENASVLKESIYEEDKLIVSDLDMGLLMHDRAKMSSYMSDLVKKEYRKITISTGYLSLLSDAGKPEDAVYRKISRNPFVPSESQIEFRYKEILKLQVTALAQRMKKTGIKKAVIGISGGLDSTLALLVTVEAFETLGLDHKGIIAVTMPGFGTTDRTLSNSMKLMELMGCTIRNISIKESCILHYKNIEHDMEVKDITYENVQARERTQILMNLANKEGGLVIGTGDLSELALGWCTYNGDHMSMYAVNTSIPKTLVRYIVRGYGKMTDSEEIRKVLEDICDTPISPELLPPDENGNIAQKTEDAIGSYDLNDFFLFHVLRNGFTPVKILEMAMIAYREMSRDALVEAMKKFYQRFYTQQFKRSCIPDGVKVGSVNLSPRGDFRCPSDIPWRAVMEQLEQL